MEVTISIRDSREPGISIGRLDIMADKGRDLNFHHPIPSDPNRTLAETELLLIEQLRSFLNQAQDRSK